MPTAKKIAIVAFTGHNRLAPWKDPSWELWGLNDLHSTFLALGGPDIFTSGRVRWFQFHREVAGEFHGVRDPEHMAWLKSQTVTPVYMWHTHPDVPASREYPLRTILREFRPYFNNSISWMIAMAIHEGATELGVYGVDMAMDGVFGAEYGHQRPSCEYFLGVAEARGIKVYLPDESELLKVPYLYGYDNIDPVRRKLIVRYEQLGNDEQGAMDAYEANKRVMHEIRGAKQERALMLRHQAVQQLGGEPIPDAAALGKVIEQLQKTSDERFMELERLEMEATNEHEAIKRALHECRGAKKDVEWLLRNYIGPGEGGVQDQPRTERSIVADELVGDLTERSDGQRDTPTVSLAERRARASIRPPFKRPPHTGDTPVRSRASLKVRKEKDDGVPA